MTEKIIIDSLFSYFQNGYKYQTPNAFVYNWECDFFCINNKGYAFEFEAKISRSDFFSDFKKEKHKDFQREIDNFSGRRMLIPNRFYYAVPDGMIDTKEIPAYAGLIYIGKNNRAWIVKNAPFIHKRIYDYRKTLCDKYYYRLMDSLRQKRIMQRNVENLQKRLDIMQEKFPDEYNSLFMPWLL